MEAKQCGAVFVRDADVHSLLVEEMFPISSDLVPEEEKLRHYEVLSTYADCLSKGPWDLGTAKGVQHTINTGSSKPIQVLPRRVPFHKRQEMRNQVDEILEAEIIELSDSPWSSPVVLVAKPDGSQRFCVDYRALNSVTKRDLYPLPRCDDILESLSGAQWFSHLDLLRGYWQIDMAEEDREKTVFATLVGLYQFRKLSFGLTNAPACFMRAMHLILKGLCQSDCLVYLDDIIVFGRTLQEHRERLSLVLSSLTEAGLNINPKKCKLLCEQVVVLGHVVSREGISTPKAESNYSTTRKELLALVWGTEHFKTFLYGRRFLVRTDHSALQWLWNFKNLRGQVARWLERLSDFDFEVEHRTGQLHGNADGLSCLPWDEGALVKVERDATLIQSVNMEPLSRESIRAAQNQDPVLSQVMRWLETGVRPARGDVEGGGNFCHTGHNGEGYFSGTVRCLDVGNTK